MRKLLLETEDETLPIVVSGSAGSLTQGYAIKKGDCGTRPSAWVSRNTTLILGCHPDCDEKETGPSSAEWVFRVDRRLMSKAQGAVLLICCDRRQGGLHSQTEGALARVLFNDREVDVIGLREIASGHTDYFHRVTQPEVPAVPAVQNCGTVYSFSVPVDFFRKDGAEKVSLSVDRSVRWDIDHLVLVVKITRRRIRRWFIAVAFSVLGAIGTLILNEVWKYFFPGSQ